MKNQDERLWKIDNFEAFVSARQKLILDHFDYMLRKANTSGMFVHAGQGD